MDVIKTEQNETGVLFPNGKSIPIRGRVHPTNLKLTEMQYWSERMRALDMAHYTRSEIAQILGKRYQHVHNVLKNSLAKKSPDRPQNMPIAVSVANDPPPNQLADIQNKALILGNNLRLPRCPHCGIANPNLTRFNYSQRENPTDHLDIKQELLWYFYACNSCNLIVTAYSTGRDEPIIEYFPESKTAKDEIPKRPRTYLQQALDSLHAPSSAIILAASSVDSMLKLKGYNEGKLYYRIDKAAADHLITKEMAAWAHEIRLRANDERHANENAEMSTREDAKRATDFALALAEFLFVLPAEVERGRGKRSKSSDG